MGTVFFCGQGKNCSQEKNCRQFLTTEKKLWAILDDRKKTVGSSCRQLKNCWQLLTTVKRLWLRKTVGNSWLQGNTVGSSWLNTVGSLSRPGANRGSPSGFVFEGVLRVFWGFGSGGGANYGYIRIGVPTKCADFVQSNLSWCVRSAFDQSTRHGADGTSAV